MAQAYPHNRFNWQLPEMIATFNKSK